MDLTEKNKLLAMLREATKLLENMDASPAQSVRAHSAHVETCLRVLVTLSTETDWVPPGAIASAVAVASAADVDPANVGRWLKPYEGVGIEVDGIGVVTVYRQRDTRAGNWKYRAQVS